MQLYYISAVAPDDADFSLDLFVSANDADEAITLWQEWTKGDLNIVSDDYTLFAVPPVADKPIAHPWHVDGPLGVQLA